MSFQKMQQTKGPSIDEIASARNQAYRQGVSAENQEIAYEPEPSDDECEWDILTVDGISIGGQTHLDISQIRDIILDDQGIIILDIRVDQVA